MFTNFAIPKNMGHLVEMENLDIGSLTVLRDRWY
jgi:hypothetical protein